MLSITGHRALSVREGEKMENNWCRFQVDTSILLDENFFQGSHFSPFFYSDTKLSYSEKSAHFLPWYLRVNLPEQCSYMAISKYSFLDCSWRAGGPEESNVIIKTVSRGRSGGTSLKASPSNLTALA